MHLAHGACAAGEPGRAALQEIVAARCGVTCVQIAIWSTLIPAAFVVEGANIDAPFVIAEA